MEVCGRGREVGRAGRAGWSCPWWLGSWGEGRDHLFFGWSVPAERSVLFVRNVPAAAAAAWLDPADAACLVAAGWDVCEKVVFPCPAAAASHVCCWLWLCCTAADRLNVAPLAERLWLLGGWAAAAAHLAAAAAAAVDEEDTEGGADVFAADVAEPDAAGVLTQARA